MDVLRSKIGKNPIIILLLSRKSTKQSDKTPRLESIGSGLEYDRSKTDKSHSRHLILDDNAEP